MKSKTLYLLFLQCLYWTGQAQTALYDPGKITEIKIQFADPNWKVKLDSLKKAYSAERLPALLTLDGEKYPGVGVRYKGNSSFYNVEKSGSKKLPLNIKVNYEDSKRRLPDGYGSLKLANVFRDPSYIREALSYEIIGKYMPAPKSNFAKVYLDNQYIGLYSNVESIGDEFILKHYGTKKGNLIKCDPEWNLKPAPNCPESDKASLQYMGTDTLCYRGFYELDNPAGWPRFHELLLTINKTPDNIESILNVDQALWMLALNNVLVNLDSYIGLFCHNYYLYQDTFGVFQPLIWDLNLSFGGFKYTGLSKGMSKQEMIEMSPFLHYKEQNKKRPLVLALLRNDLFRKVYIAHLKTIVQENFSNGWYLTRAQQLQSIIDKTVAEDPGKLYTYEAFIQNKSTSVQADESEIVGIEELMAKRTGVLLNHPLFKKETPQIKDWSASKTNGKILIAADTDIEASTVWICFRPIPGAPFQRIAMQKQTATAVNNLQSWQTELAQPAEKLQFYFIAEGKVTASVFPARATMELLTVK